MACFVILGDSKFADLMLSMKLGAYSYAPSFMLRLAPLLLAL